jgi:ribosomal-protein-alanine N-acetyltransferase
MANVIRRAEERDVAALQHLQAATPGMPEWTPVHWLGLLSGDAIVVIAEADGEVAGYAVASLLRIPGEVVAELEAIVVAPSHRRNGVGNGLLRYLLAEAQAAGAIRLMLEVRTGNGAARALYRGLGFQEEGLRRRYYRDPVEDAVLMSLQFPQEAVAAEKGPE